MSDFRAERAECDTETFSHASEEAAMAPFPESMTAAGILRMVVREMELHIPRPSLSMPSYGLRKGG
jgi:hypothetical protein